MYQLWGYLNLFNLFITMFSSHIIMYLCGYLLHSLKYSHDEISLNQYIRNIVESGVIHYQTNKQTDNQYTDAQMLFLLRRTLFDKSRVSNITGVTFITVTAIPSRTPEHIPSFRGVRIARFLGFYDMLCTLLFLSLYCCHAIIIYVIIPTEWSKICFIV